jgi:hypothetical protein
LIAKGVASALLRQRVRKNMKTQGDSWRTRATAEGTFRNLLLATLLRPSPLFCASVVLILKVDKVVCFGALLQVLIPMQFLEGR